MTARALTGLDPDLWTRLEKLAEAADRNVSDLVGSVLREFVDENDRQVAAIQAGLAEAEAGELLDYDEVKAALQAKLSALSAKR